MDSLPDLNALFYLWTISVFVIGAFIAYALIPAWVKMGKFVFRRIDGKEMKGSEAFELVWKTAVVVLVYVAISVAGFWTFAFFE